MFTAVLPLLALALTGPSAAQTIDPKWVNTTAYFVDLVQCGVTTLHWHDPREKRPDMYYPTDLTFYKIPDIQTPIAKFTALPGASIKLRVNLPEGSRLFVDSFSTDQGFAGTGQGTVVASLDTSCLGASAAIELADDAAPPPSSSSTPEKSSSSAPEETSTSSTTSYATISSTVTPDPSAPELGSTSASPSANIPVSDAPPTSGGSASSGVPVTSGTTSAAPRPNASASASGSSIARATVITSGSSADNPAATAQGAASGAAPLCLPAPLALAFAGAAALGVVMC